MTTKPTPRLDTRIASQVEQMKRMETIVAAKEIAEIEKKNRQNSPAATVPTVSPTIVENPVNFTSEELESKSSRIN